MDVLPWTRCVLALMPLFMASPFRVAGALEPTSAERKSEQGRVLLHAGDCSRVVAHFRESQQLDPPGTLMNVATCESELGQVSGAWQHSGEAIELLSAANPRLAFASAKRSEIAARVGWLELSLPTSVPSGLRAITREMPTEVLRPEGATPLDPGKRELLVEAPGHRVKVNQIQLTGGETKRLTVELGAPLNGSAGVSAKGIEARSIPLWAGFEVGNVGRSRVATNLMLSERGNILRQRCASSQARTCDAESTAAARRGDGSLPIDTIGPSYGVGALGVGLGALSIVSRSGDSQILVKERPKGALIEYRQRF